VTLLLLLTTLAYPQDSAILPAPAQIEERLDEQIEKIDLLIAALNRVAEIESAEARGGLPSSVHVSAEPEPEQSPEAPVEEEQDSAEDLFGGPTSDTSADSAEEG
jgi:hypothetical protein